MWAATKINGIRFWLALGLVWLASLLVIGILIAEPKVEPSAQSAPVEGRRGEGVSAHRGTLEQDKTAQLPVRQTAQVNPPTPQPSPTPFAHTPDGNESATQGQFMTAFENAPALGRFLRALGDRKAGRRKEPVRVVQFGDSHVAAGVLAEELRKTLQRDFGDESAPRRAVAILEVRGVNGARAVELTRWSEREFAGIKARQPDLIMLAYGANEVTDDDWTVDSYERMFADILRRFQRVAPDAAILVFGPPDRAVKSRGSWQSVERMPELIEAQRRAALETGATFWDAYQAMGGGGTINDWVSRGLGQRDHVHLTTEGYVKLSDLLYRDLKEALAQMPTLRDEVVSESGEK